MDRGHFKYIHILLGSMADKIGYITVYEDISKNPVLNRSSDCIYDLDLTNKRAIVLDAGYYDSKDLMGMGISKIGSFLIGPFTEVFILLYDVPYDGSRTTQLYKENNSPENSIFQECSVIEYADKRLKSITIRPYGSFDASDIYF